MKTIYMTIFLAMTLVFSSFKDGGHDGIRFHNTKWSDITKEAKQKDKPIFAMVCAPWCSKCSQLRNEVFTNPEVGKFFNDHFVSTMVDSEDFKNNIRVTNWGVKSVPTMVFLDKNHKVVYMATGYRDVNKLLEEAQKALEEMQ